MKNHGGHGSGHQKDHKKADGHHMGTQGNLGAGKKGEEKTRSPGEGLGDGYNAPEKYQGSEDSDNTHCC